MLFTEERASCWFGSTWGRVNDDRTFIRGWTIPLKVWTTAFPKLQGWASCQSKWRQSGSSRADRGTAPVRAPRPPLTGRTRKCHHDQPYMGWILNHNCKMKTWTYGTSFWAQHHRLPSRSERSALHNTTLRRGQAAYSCQAARRRLEGGTHLFSADNNKQQNEAEKDGGGGGLLPLVPHGHADEFIVYTGIWAPRRARPSPPPPPREPAAAARRGHPCPASRRRAAYPVETATVGRLPELQWQIRERLDEVLRYRQRRAHWVGTGPLERRRLMDLEQRGEGETYKGIGKNNNYDQSQPTVSIATKSHREFTRESVLGCSSIDNVTNVQYLGSGYTKAVYKATLNSSFSVALKSVDFGGHDMENCVKKYGSSTDCYKLASFKIVKEMTLMERLQHPNILKVIKLTLF